MEPQGLTALLGLAAPPVEYEPMSDDELQAVAACYEELRRGHVGSHFTVVLYGTNDQMQIRLHFTRMSPQIVDEIRDTARRHGLLMSLGSEEDVRGGQIIGVTVLLIGPLARVKDDETIDTPGPVH